MKVTPLDPLLPPLTEEQQAAVHELMIPVLKHPEARFRVEDFPGARTVDIARLREMGAQFVNLKERAFSVERDGDALIVSAPRKIRRGPVFLTAEGS